LENAEIRAIKMGSQAGDVGASKLFLLGVTTGSAEGGAGAGGTVVPSPGASIAFGEKNGKYLVIWQCVKTLYPCSSHQNSW
jgi:hypothetical protein